MAFEVPEHLQGRKLRGRSRLGHGDGYAMPGSESEGRAQEYMPEERCYYRPGDEWL